MGDNALSAGVHSVITYFYYVAIQSSSFSYSQKALYTILLLLCKRPFMLLQNNSFCS